MINAPPVPVHPDDCITTYRDADGVWITRRLDADLAFVEVIHSVAREDQEA